MSPNVFCFFYYELYQPPTDKVSSSKNGHIYFPFQPVQFLKHTPSAINHLTMSKFSANFVKLIFVSNVLRVHSQRCQSYQF